MQIKRREIEKDFNRIAGLAKANPDEIYEVVDKQGEILLFVSGGGFVPKLVPKDRKDVFKKLQKELSVNKDIVVPKEASEMSSCEDCLLKVERLIQYGGSGRCYRCDGYARREGKAEESIEKTPCGDCGALVESPARFGLKDRCYRCDGFARGI